MKKLMMALALAGSAACFAQDAGTPEKKPTPQEKRAMRPHREHRGMENRLPLQTDRPEHRVHRRVLGQDHHMAAGLDDPRLLPGDLGKGISQGLHVVHADGGDDRQVRAVDDVGGVQPSAQPHLQHYQIGGLLPEPEKGHGADQLELRGQVQAVPLHLLHRVPDGTGVTAQVLFGDLPVPDADALGEPLQIGRGVKPHTEARLLEDGAEKGCGGALSVGSGYMDKPQLLLRIAQPGKQGADGVQVEGLLAGGQLPGGEPGPGADIFQSFPIGHCSISSFFLAVRVRAVMGRTRRVSTTIWKARVTSSLGSRETTRAQKGAP